MKINAHGRSLYRKFSRQPFSMVIASTSLMQSIKVGVISNRIKSFIDIPAPINRFRGLMKLWTFRFSSSSLVIRPQKLSRPEKLSVYGLIDLSFERLSIICQQVNLHSPRKFLRTCLKWVRCPVCDVFPL